MEFFISIIIGMGFSAASGFRIFIPFLILSIAGINEIMELNTNFSWMLSVQAIIIFSFLTLAEIFGYFNPWMDNMLDTIALPLSFIAGTILSLSLVSGIDPVLCWIISIIFGGGTAVTFQFLTIKARSVSSIFESGYGNKIIAGGELSLSLIFSILSVFAPEISFILIFVMMLILFRSLKKARESLNEMF